MGPYGAYLANGEEYTGNYGLTEKELMDFHRPRMRALIEAGADLLACETIPCLIEAQALVRLLGEFQSVHAWISFSCRDEAHVCEGDKFEDCIRQIEASPFVDAVGVELHIAQLSSLDPRSKKGDANLCWCIPIPATYGA